MRTSDTNEAVAIASALRPTVDEWERESSRSCVRAKKMTVASAYDPDTMTVGVREAFTPDIMSIPCMPDLSTVSVGDTIWVLWLYGDKSTMVAMWRGDIVTAPELDPHSYYAGDGISGSFMCFGYITSSKKDLCVFVPMVKNTMNVTLAATDITTLTITLFRPSGGLVKSNENYDVLADSTVTVTATTQQGGILLLMTSTSDWYSTNNIPVNGTISLAGTFS